MKPGTPYDLLLPYRTDDLEWTIADPEGVEFIHIGQRRPLEQVMFGEGTIRGRHTITVLDRDEKLGPVFVASWSFAVGD